MAQATRVMARSDEDDEDRHKNGKATRNNDFAGVRINRDWPLERFGRTQNTGPEC